MRDGEHDAGRCRIFGLAELAGAARERHRPLERWDPPYCGDIGLAVRADGAWLYRGSPILRPPLVNLFASVLWRDPDGRHYLVTPAEKVDVRVEDAPFLAVEMELIGHGRGQELVFRTNVDDIVTIGPGHPIRFARDGARGGLKPYVAVRGGLEALVTRAITFDLVEIALAEAGRDDGRPGLWSGGRFFPLPDEQPTP